MYTLPHPLDRQYQQSTAERILKSSKKFIIVQAPTGSGKTAYVAYAASQGLKTLACVRTKSLQRQYEQGYSFIPFFGKGNYKCLEFGKQPELFDDTYKIEPTADICEVSEDFKEDCINNCPYPLARSKFVNSQAGILNYAKFLLDRRVTDDFGPDILFLDEAHELGESIVTGFSGTEMKWTKRLLEYTNPIYIKIDQYKPYPIAQKIAFEKGKDFLQSLYWTLKRKTPKHPSKGGNVYEWKWHKRKMEQIDITLASMDTKPNVWFIDSNNERFLIKPLTSEFHFLSQFNKSPKIVLMSATIQKADIDALGIDDYEFIKVPNTIKPENRPVHNLKGPKITAKTTKEEYEQHANIISKPFQDNPNWNGIIHVTSKAMARNITELLTKKLDNPIWLPDTENSTATDEAYNQWSEFNSQNERAICVAWQFFAGTDMGDVAINISARMPYPYFGDDYERSRFNYHPKQALVRVANSLEQQMGRNRRGFDQHYGPDADKFNGIADGKWTRLKSSMNKDFLASIK